MMLRLSTLWLASATLLFTSCRDREITAYRAPKDPAPTVSTALPAPATMAAQGQLPEGHPPIGQPASDPGAMTGTVPTAPGGALVWTAPAHWTAKSLGSMRKGSYSLSGENGATADLAITAFPGDTGGLFANVNRWRGQIGLPPIEASQLASNVEHLDVNEFHIDLVSCVGTASGQPTALLGAIVPHQGETWFFKLVGPAALVEKEKTAFREFLQTIKAR